MCQNRQDNDWLSLMWHSVLPVIVAGKSHAESLETSGASYAGSDKPLHQRTELRGR